MNEDITEGYRLTKLPHPRQVADNYFTSKAQALLELNEKEKNTTNRIMSTNLSAQSSSTATSTASSSGSEPSINTVLGDESHQTIVSSKGLNASNCEESTKPDEAVLKSSMSSISGLNRKFLSQKLDKKLKTKSINLEDTVVDTAPGGCSTGTSSFGVSSIVNNVSKTFGSGNKSKTSIMPVSKSYSSPISAVLSSAYSSSSSSTSSSSSSSNKQQQANKNVDLASTWSTGQFTINKSNKKKLVLSNSIEADTVDKKQSEKIVYKGYLYKYSN